MAITAPERGANPFDSSGVRSDENGVRRYTDLHDSIVAMLRETVDASPYNGKADLPHLAQGLQMEIDDLFPIAETLQLLRFAEMEEGDIRLTPDGRRFARGDSASLRCGQ